MIAVVEHGGREVSLALDAWPPSQEDVVRALDLFALGEYGERRSSAVWFEPAGPGRAAAVAHLRGANRRVRLVFRIDNQGLTVK